MQSGTQSICTVHICCKGKCQMKNLEVMAEDAIKRKEKMGFQWTHDELEEILGDDGYWD